MKYLIKLVSCFALGKISVCDQVLQRFRHKSFAYTKSKWDFDYDLKSRDVTDFGSSKKAFETLYLICLPKNILDTKYDQDDQEDKDDQGDKDNLDDKAKLHDCNADLQTSLIYSLIHEVISFEPDIYKPNFYKLSSNIKNKVKSYNELLSYNDPYPSSPAINLLAPYQTTKNSVYFNIFRTYSESKLQQYGRAEALFRKEAACMEKSKVIIGPPATIAYIFTRLMQYPAETWSRFQFPHCSLTTLKVYDSGFVRAYGVGETFKLKRDEVDIGDCITYQEFTE